MKFYKNYSNAVKFNYHQPIEAVSLDGIVGYAVRSQLRIKKQIRHDQFSWMEGTVRHFIVVETIGGLFGTCWFDNTHDKGVSIILFKREEDAINNHTSIVEKFKNDPKWQVPVIKSA